MARKSKVSDPEALAGFMSGKKTGGKRRSAYSGNPQGRTYSKNYRAEKMDKGLPLRK